jgi:hypothetical protein
VVDELLDELQGHVSSQKWTSVLVIIVRVHPDDVHKTAFRTHHGHFEFLVMPFCLSNAPTTFQALMNEVLGQFLHRFVLVFFEDIFIYIATWSEHLMHVKAVLEALHTNKLFVKQSKCDFGATSVAYLGSQGGDHGQQQG